MNELMIMALLFIGIGVLLFAVWAWRHAEMQRRVLEQQRKRVKNLRLNKMLEYIGIDQVTYLRKVSDSVIEQQIYRCSQCTNTDACDACLLDRRCFIDMHFCPNYSSLMAQSQNLGKRIRPA